MKNLQALLFDLDGTLLNSAPDIRQAVNALLASYDRSLLSLDEVTSMIGDGVMPLVQRAFEATGGAPAGDVFPYVQKFIQFYRTLDPDPTQVYPGGREALDYYAKAGIKLAVCTNKPEALSKRILSTLGLLDYFSFVAGGDTFEVHKPHPGHIRGIAEALGVALDACVFVGDGPNDAVASQKAGIPCIVVAHGYAAPDQDFGDAKVIDSFEGLAKALADFGFAPVS